MFTFIIILMLLVSFLLALVVLAQNPKGGGISSQFGSGGANLMGVKRTGDLLEKLTWGFAIALMVLALSTHMLSGGSSPVQSVNQQRAQQTRSTTPAAPAPGAPATPVPAGAAPATAPTSAPVK